MADVQPLRALHYDLAKVGSLDDVVAPPYDVIDPEQRGRLAARSPYNVVRVDLPEASRAATRTPRPPRIFERWQQEGAVVRDDEPALWALTQDYTGPDGRALTRHGVLRARARRGLRPRPHPPARAHAPRPQGGPPAAHARDEGEPLPDLQPLRRPRPAPPGPRVARSAARALRRGDRRRRHRQPPLARRRPRGDRGRPERARARRAADRRRPPPLRDRARLRRRDRRRGRAPLRAHVPRRAGGPGADRLPHPPPRSATPTPQTPGGAGDHAARALRRRGDRPAPTSCARPTATAR